MMKKHHLLSPHRRVYRAPRVHDGRITTDRPGVMWGSDGTNGLTLKEGRVWIFSVADHWNTKCMGWHVCKVGDRFAALEPIYMGIKWMYCAVSKGVAKGLKLRIDHGSQYTSDDFLEQIA